MKIITLKPKPARREKAWWINLELTCTKCGTVFVLEKKDKIKRSDMHVCRTTGTVYGIMTKCPACNGWVHQLRPSPDHFRVKKPKIWEGLKGARKVA